MRKLFIDGAIVRNITFLCIAIVSFYFIIALYLNFSNTFYIALVSILLCLCTVLVLLKHSEVMAKICFLLTSYVIIFFLTPLFGYNMLTYTFLIPGVGMPLIFFNEEIGYKKWFFVFLGFPVYLAIEFWAKHWSPVINFSAEVIEIMATVNILLALITSTAMFYIFTERSRNDSKIIRQKNKEINNSIKRLQQFNNILIHDLKSPVAAIKSTTNYLSDSPKITAEELKEFIDILDESSENALNLITNITNYFKHTRQQSMIRLNLKTIVTDVLSVVAKPANFELNYGNIPTICFSEIAMKQIMQNLITNAIKYNDKPVVKINISVRDSRRWHIITFSDNGIGMSEKQIKQAFDLFTIFQNAKTNKDSSGMGLAIVKELIETHNGKVNIESEMGIGTTFTIKIPIARG